MATKIDDLFFEISVRKGPGADAEIQKFAGQFRKVGAESQKAGAGVQQFTRASKGASTAGAGLNNVLKRMLLAFGGFAILRGVVKSMVGFETAIAEIATIADPTVTNIDELTRGVAALARESPQTPDDLGAGAYQILSAGIIQTNDVLEVLRVSSRAATAGLTDTATAVDGITTVINAFGLTAADAQRVADVLFTTVRLGKVRFEEISGSIGNAATSAALAGVTIEELSAGVVALTKAGINAQEATSSLNRLFLTLTSQSKAQSAAFAELGIEFNIATVAADGFAGLLAEVAKITGDDIDALAKLFPNIRAARSAFVIAGSGAENFATALEQLNNAAGATDEAFEKIAETSAAQAQILKNTLQVTFQEIGLAVLPSVSKAFAFLSKSIGDFILQIKITGADLAVFDAQATLFFKRLGLIVADTIRSVVGDLEEVGDRIADFLQNAAAIANVLPIGGGALSTALQTIGDGFRAAGESSNEFISGLVEGVEEAEAFAAAVEVARDEVIKEALAESEFSNQLRARSEAQEAASKITEEIARKTEEQLASEQKLREQLTALIVSSTLTAVEQQTLALDQLEAKFRETFGEIPEIARREFARLREVIEDARVEEAAAAIAEEFGRALEEGLQDIEIETIGIEDATARTSALLEKQRALLNEIQAQVRERLKATDLTEKEERALNKVLVETTKELRNINKEEKERLEATGKAEEELARARFESLQTAVGLIRQGAEGAADLANAFGLVDDQVLGIIDNLLQAGNAATTLINALATGAGGIGGILAGGTALIGALGGLLGGGGPSPEAERLRQVLEDNNKALKDLRDSVNELRGTFDITGADFGAALRDLLGAQDALEQLAAELETLIGPGGIFEGIAEEILEQIAPTLRALGIDFDNLDEIAEELGITIRDQAGNIIPSALLELLDALEAIEGSIVGFAENLGGAFARFRAEIEIFDITDPIEQFKLLQERLLDIQEVDPAEIFAILNDESLGFLQRVEKLTQAFETAGRNITPFLAELLAIDVSTPEGRAQAEETIRNLFTQLAEGLIDPEDLGAATFEEAVQILKELEGILDNVEEEGEDSGEELGDQTQDIRRNIQITELQGNQLLAFLSTQAILQQQMVILLEAILAQLGGAPVTGLDTGRLRDLIEPEIQPPTEPLITPEAPDGIREELEGLRGDLAVAPPAAEDAVSELEGLRDDLEGVREDLVQAAVQPPDDAIRDELEALRDDLVEAAKEPAEDGIRDELAGLRDDLVDAAEPAEDGLAALRDDLIEAAREPAEDGLTALRDELAELAIQPPAVQDGLAELLEELTEAAIQAPEIVEPKPTEDLTSAIDRLTGQLEQPAITPEAAPVIGTVNIEANINLAPGTTPEDAEEVREILLDNLAEQLGQRIRDREQLLGLPAERRQGRTQ